MRLKNQFIGILTFSNFHIFLQTTPMPTLHISSFRVCTTYVKSLNVTNLTTQNCHNIYSLTSEEAQAAIQHINHETNQWIKMTTLAAQLPSLLTDCFIGGWSDMFGRKLPMYLPSIGGVLGNIVYIIFVLNESMDPSWLCLASFLSGIFGGVTSVIANCFTYVSSIAPIENRTLRYSML